MKTKIEETGSDEHRCLIKDMEPMLGRGKLPKLVPNCCIYKVSQKTRETNPVAYTPQVVSIGPLHHGDKMLEAMEELKMGYPMSYLERTNKKLEDCTGKLKEREEYIRGCYADTISQSSDDFVKMILIDACFIIEYLLRFNEFDKWIKIDPILSTPSRRYDMRMDLILLENQLPSFVLEDLFTLTCINGRQYSSFLEVSIIHFVLPCSMVAKLGNDEFKFDNFREHHLKKRWTNGECEEVTVQHLTDLLRIFYLPRCELQPNRGGGFLGHLYSASRLFEKAGLKFKVCQNKSLIELQFERGVLTMPQLIVEDNTETFLRNMAALEQFSYPYETYIGEYLALLDFLINERKDVDILVDKKIMVKNVGDNDKVVVIYNDICRGIVLSSHKADYLKLYQSLNHFCKKPYHKYKAIFIRDYFSTPWKIASFIAATVLLLLILIQSISSIFSLLAPG